MYGSSTVVCLYTKCIEKHRNVNVDFVGNTDNTDTDDEWYYYITLLLGYIKVLISDIR